MAKRTIAKNYMNMDYEELLERMTPHQREFVLAYNGSAKETIEKLGLNYNHCKQYTSLRHIQRALRLRAEYEDIPDAIADRQERQMFWTDIMRNSEDLELRLKASTLLGKSQADFIDRKVIEGGDKSIGLNVSQIDLGERIQQLREAAIEVTAKVIEESAIDDMDFFEEEDEC